MDNQVNGYMEESKMKQLLKQLSDSKPDIVFVGGVSEFLQGARTETKDIDICVNNLSGLDFFGEIESWRSSTPFTISGNRAGITRTDFDIDIFIEEELPEYIIIDQMKCETLDCLLERYKEIVPKLKPEEHYSKNKMISKITNLENFLKMNDKK